MCGANLRRPAPRTGAHERWRLLFGLGVLTQERQERLDPENRPKNAEVDNSARDFDIASGQFTDHDKDEEIGPFNDPTAPDGEIEA